MMELFRHELAGCHADQRRPSPGLEDFHERKLTLQRRPTRLGRDLRAQARGARLLSRLLRRSLRPRPSPDPSVPGSL